ncbi:MAG: hypothetical protein ACOXZ4_04500 [Sphaerochaetaceae bacterium]|jgi:hypothetical protein
MKKILVTILLLSVVLFAAFAENVGSGSLNVYGKIGEGTASFTVNQTNSVPIDLINNEDVQPEGDGVVLGSWVFLATNQAGVRNYTVNYATTDLSSGSLTPIPFEVIELDDGTPVPLVDGKTGFDATAGNNNITRDIAVKLLDAIAPGAPASANYTGSITVTLTTE